MSTYNFNGNNPLPPIVIEVKRANTFAGNASFRRNATMGNQTLTVTYSSDNAVVMRSIDGEFEHWSDHEKVELVSLLSRFCVKSIEERYE